MDERHDIELCLHKRLPFKEIGRILERDPTTVSKEVVNHIKVREVGGRSMGFNACKKREICKRIQSVCKPCHHPHTKGLLCQRCGECNHVCQEFEEEHCPQLDVPPYVCNGCVGLTRCRLRKHFYYADFAQQEYEAVRSESRQGIAVTPEELRRIDMIISPLLKRGQSIHHICVSHADEIMLSERTIYSYIDAGLLSAGNLDLPRKVRYRRRVKKKTIRLDKRCHKGRTYQDFLQVY